MTALSLSRMLGTAFIATLLFCTATARAETPGGGEIVLTGTLTRADHRGYQALRFTVPPGARGLSIALNYQRGVPWAAIDMALYDPLRFRGASGFAKTRIFVGEVNATPSYLPGPLPPGEWTLVLGGANAPEGRETPYEARIRIETDPNAGAALFAGVIRDEAGWYRGDFHTHTGHSDGVCAASSGKRVPCPVYRTLETAEARGLDFIAVSDHNTISHLESLSELLPAFDTLAIIPAQEVTTYSGHLNVYGLTLPIDFRLGTDYMPSVVAMSEAVARLGGAIAINHPGISLTEGCPGCGWSAETVDYDAIDAIEIVNGTIARWSGGPEGMGTSIPFWFARLNEGHRVTAIGGSDNHDGRDTTDILSTIGRPASVVYAEALSGPAILEGMRKGRVFIDLEGVKERRFILTASSGRQKAQMGDVMTPRRGASIRFLIQAEKVPAGSRLEIWRDGQVLETEASGPALSGDAMRPFTWIADGKPHWFAAALRASDGRLLLIANPIYVRP
ncbi:MAG: CehA/McbA family metallohydrolase [Alphaproteobacteria bacterium]|nr:CehA/McbA family metallohydrolase [Alphaproteobacteria bacterium]